MSDSSDNSGAEQPEGLAADESVTTGQETWPASAAAVGEEARDVGRASEGDAYAREGYGQPDHADQTYAQGAYGHETAYDQPTYGQSTYSAPTYGQSTYGQPPYAQPPYGQPAGGSDPTAQYAYTPPAAPPVAPPASAAGPARGGSRLLAGLAVGALIGGLVGGGVAVATRGEKTKVVNGASAVGVSTATTGKGTPTPPIVGGNDVRAVLDKVEPGVVSIRTTSGAGTGMIISPDGEVLTNAHVVCNENGRGCASTVKVTLFKESQARTADVLGANTSADVALVKIRNASGLPTVTLGDSDKAEVGDSVVAIGNALNLAGGPTVTTGIVSAKDRSLDQESDTFIQTDAAINPGNSGGPLTNSLGDVIGMNTLVIQQAGANEAAQNLGFAIQVNEIKPLLDDLRKGGNQAQSGGAFLGVANLATVTPDLKDQLGLSVDRGAIIGDVEPGAAAEQAGLQRNDVITTFDGKPVTSASQLAVLIRAKKPGDKVTIEFVRGNDKKSVEVTLGTRPPDTTP